jgi:hypothetical protein
MEDPIPDFTDTSTIQHYISSIISFLTEYKSLIRAHMTESYIHNYFSEIPSSWLSSLLNFSYLDYLNIFSILPRVTFTQLENDSLHSFLSKAKSLSPNFPKSSSSILIPFKETVGMSPKKIHETSKLAPFISTHFKSHEINQIIDLGAGQGYLSFLLASRYDFKVTAIEGRKHNSEKSQERAERIGKSISGKNLLQNVCQIVTGEDLESLGGETCGIVGLHTCGDLASDSIKMFVNGKNVKAIINVACCYQLLSELVDKNCPEYLEYVEYLGLGTEGRSLDESLTDNPEKAGFPLSDFIRSNFKGFLLGKLTRSLCIGDSSSQNSKKAMFNFVKMEYRAAFQYLLTTRFPNFDKVFAIGSKIRRFEDFAGYCDAAFEKLKLKNPFDKEELNSFYDVNFKEGSKKVSALWTLRSVFSGPVENLILLDRVLFLKEQGMEVQAFSIFDRGQSPRNTAICAFKLH